MPPPLPPPPRPELRRVDPRIWRACAGNSVQIPTLHSRVYYFPQGHLEQSSSPNLSLSPLLSKPLLLCQISALQFLADPVTDEVFAKLLLQPLEPSRNHFGFLETQDDQEEEKIVSFAKILTPSDANNGGGFSVPRFCADSIFPPLNFQADPPVQTLSITDVHGVVWEFRHIYRGTPRRHLLTTGWSKFVNHKKLIAGDSVVFMKNLRGEMFVGVRRAVRWGASGDGVIYRWREQIGGGRVKLAEEESGGREVFSRNWRGRVSPEAVVEAAELAAQGMAFEVVYYPKAGWSEFVVKAEVVNQALNVYWTAGMRVKMPMETDDSSRMTWFQGTVSVASVPDVGPWRGSPWRMLQVTWDEPEILQNAKRVSPWQVEFVAPTPTLPTVFPPAKKFRVPTNSGLLNDGEGELFFPMTGYTNSAMVHLNPPLLNNNFFPAGMQGARQDPFCIFSLCDFVNQNTPQMCSDNIFGNHAVPKLKPPVSTELNIGSSQSDNLSPDSQSSLHSFGTEHVGNQGCNSEKVGISSFQLFGTIIHMQEPVEGGFDDVGCTEDDGSKGYNETSGKNSVDLSLKYPYSELLDRLDVQCQRASTVEAYPM